ncbi:hypothetical protein J637_0953 [Acinetobacter baumannii 273929]|nr:hypothetical protein J637_0953 [Acinetobacter baumannii 273929]
MWVFFIKNVYLKNIFKLAKFYIRGLFKLDKKIQIICFA